MAAAEAPPEGPGSGFLVVVDEAAVEQASRMCRDRGVRSSPFPQSQQLSLKQDDTPHPAETASDCLPEILDKCLDISSGPSRPPSTRNVTVPPPTTPCSCPSSASRCRPASTMSSAPTASTPGRCRRVPGPGRRTGRRAAASAPSPTTCRRGASTTATCTSRWRCSSSRVPGKNGFRAVAVAGDGIPPDYLRKKKGWKAVGMASPVYDLADDAQRVDTALRALMPNGLDGAGVVVVGRWYVPFVFVFVKADGERRLKD
ncbi:hypothetical protein U9M48_000879 [Paspalum notatum var. saurae]|uniref:Uncharacterized protein n=1 Tax=Paspalum notatum var. saurae TaxID=547442 RepID=A0AAQ3SEU1_PASNO